MKNNSIVVHRLAWAPMPMGPPGKCPLGHWVKMALFILSLLLCSVILHCHCCCAVLFYTVTAVVQCCFTLSLLLCSVILHCHCCCAVLFYTVTAVVQCYFTLSLLLCIVNLHCHCCCVLSFHIGTVVVLCHCYCWQSIAILHCHCCCALSFYIVTAVIYKYIVTVVVHCHFTLSLCIVIVTVQFYSYFAIVTVFSTTVIVPYSEQSFVIIIFIVHCHYRNLQFFHYCYGVQQQLLFIRGNSFLSSSLLLYTSTLIVCCCDCIRSSYCSCLTGQKSHYPPGNHHASHLAGARAIIKVSGQQHECLAGGYDLENRTFL